MPSAGSAPSCSSSAGLFFAAINDCLRKPCLQFWHLAPECRPPTERLGGRRNWWNKTGYWTAPIRDDNFVALSNVFDQRRQILASLTNPCFFHTNIVLHV